MAVAVPPRPSLRIPRPELERQRRDSHQRATLVEPLGEDDPLDVVMDALRGVRCERAVEAASVCLAAAVRAVGCRAALIHLWDPREQNFIVVYAIGPNAPMLLNARHQADDPLLAIGFERGVPRVVNYEGARAPVPRHGILGGAWSVLVAPAMEDGEALAAMELVDPLDGSCFDDRHVAAARYATETLITLLRDAISSIGKLLVPPAE